MAVELGGEEFDRDNLRFFTGQRRACHIKLFGLANCCKNSGLLIGLGNCSASERELAQERNAGNTHYLGPLLLEAHLLRRLHPPLARLVRVRLEARAHPAAAGPRASSGSDGEAAGVLTVAEVEGIDFARLDLSEFTQDLMDGSREPSVSLPDAGDTG